MKRTITILIAVLMLIGLLPSSNVRGQDSVFLPAIFRPDPERVALVALYESTDGGNWSFKDNWLSDTVFG